MTERVDAFLRNLYERAFNEGAESTLQQWASGDAGEPPSMPHKDCRNEGSYQFVEDHRSELEALTRTQASGGANAALIEALEDIASVDRSFVDANGTDGAFEKIIARAQAALTLARDKQHTSLGAVEAVMRQAAFAATEHRYDVTGDDVVERVATAVERHFVEKFGASIHRGPSRLVALGSMVGFNPLNLAETIVAALSASSVMGKKDKA
jgi:hypothetical protein